MNKKFYFYLFCILLFIVLCFLLAVYPANFDFREENKADGISSIIFFIPLGFILLFLIITGAYTSVKRKEFELISFFKEIGEFLLISLIPYILVKPVITGLLFFINANLGPQKQMMVDGIVVYKKVRSSRGEDTQIHVEDRLKGIIEFTTFPAQAEDFWKNKRFKISMTSGSLGLIYKRKEP